MKIAVVMPGYNVANTLEQTYLALPKNLRQWVIVGNNVSQDRTEQVAKELGLQVITHERNLGYGGNLKRLYRAAVQQGADIVIEVHPDFQYEPSVADLLAEYIARDHFDVIQANRIRSRRESLAGGMPLYRYIGNRILTMFENVWFGVNFGEWHSGMRAYHRSVLEALPLETYPNTHAFASDILMDCVAYGFRVAEVPVPVRYEKQSSSVNVPGLFSYAYRTVTSALKRPPWNRKPYGSARRLATSPSLPPVANGSDPKVLKSDSASVSL